MKGSVKFREQQGPLWRAKVPILVSGMPLSTGITLDNGRDLAVHLGTSIEGGPSCRIAYRPSDACSPFSFILKMGFGQWGSPSGSALAMTAEFDLAGKRGPFFLIKMKPKIGDFNLRMQSGSLHSNKLELDADSASNGGLLRGENVGLVSDLNSMGGNIPFSTPKDGYGFNTPPLEKHPSLNGNSNLIMGSSFAAFSSESELDREKKLREDRNQNIDRLKEDDFGGVKVNFSEGENGSAIEFSNRHTEVATRRGGFIKAFKGWTAHVRTCLPLWKQARLNILWGVNVPLDLLESWESRNGTSPFSFPPKLPFLVVNKLSIESVGGLKPSNQYPSDLALLNKMPSGLAGSEHFSLGNIEVEKAMIASCYSMKLQLGHLHSETKALRKAMEEMRDEFKAGGFSADPPQSPAGYRASEESKSRLQQSEPFKKASSSGERNPKDVQGMTREKENLKREKDNSKREKESPRKDIQPDTSSPSLDGVVTPKGATPADVTEELKKALAELKT